MMVSAFEVVMLMGAGGLYALKLLMPDGAFLVNLTIEDVLTLLTRCLFLTCLLWIMRAHGQEAVR